jgi:hypothetical protein
MKKKILTAVFIVYYIASGILCYGMSLAYEQNYSTGVKLRADAARGYGRQEETNREDQGAALFFAVVPFGTPVTYLSSGFAEYGLQWKPYPAHCAKPEWCAAAK